jgi:riboflavin synthase
MFTGIVQAMGRILHVRPHADGLRLAVEAAGVGTDDVAIGDSVAVNGCCLTVVERDGAVLAFDVSAETLRCTVGLDEPAGVNLEKALRMGDALGGHLMTGHVDGVGTVAALVPVGAPLADARAPSHTLTIDAPPALARFIARKGSIALQGVSLTVNDVHGTRFGVNLIPHTLAVTTLGTLRAGSRVNLEVDLVARYVARLLDTGPELPTGAGAAGLE